MAITIRKKLGPSPYIPKSEHDVQRDAEGNEISRTPKPGAASFTLRPLTDLEKMDVQPDMRGELKGDTFLITMTGTAARRMLLLGLIGWTGVVDDDQKPIPFSQSAIDELDGDTIADLAWEIWRRSDLTEAERKNS